METKAFLKIPEGLMKKIERNPYPMHRLKRLDRPTTSIGPNIKRMDEREQAVGSASRFALGTSPIPHFIGQWVGPFNILS